MSLWGINDYATGNNKPLYSNTSNTYGVSTTEAANTQGDGQKITHTGWVKQTLGTGSIASITIGAAGTGYANGEYLTFTGGGGTGANGTVRVDGNGNVVAIVVNSYGSGYTSAPSVGVGTVAGANAALTATVGGRAGRRFYETLVATGSIAGDNTADNTYFPGV